MVRAQGPPAQDDRLYTFAGAAAHFVEYIARNTNMAAMDHAAREFDNELEKCIKHAISPHTPAPPRRFASGTMRRVK